MMAAPRGRVRRRPPPKRRRVPARAARERSELGARVVVALPALALAGVVVALGGTVFAVALLLLGWACMHELYTMVARAHPARLAGLLALIGLIAAAQYGGRDQVLIAALAAVPLTFLLTVAGPRGSATGIAFTLLGVWWIGLALAHGVMLRRLPHGGGIVVDVLVGTFVGDTGAYLGGRSFGRRALAPSISPSKTVEGLLIGILAAVVGVWFAGLYQPWLPKSHALILGAAVGVAAPLGDLFESYLKRSTHRKDSGRLFGAHGGALDRLDAVLFTAVVGYYVWLALL
jgi:phosphatidate cytidylyltransferase